MTHPLSPDLSDLTDEELDKKIGELFSKSHMANSMGMESFLTDQIGMMIQTYQEEQEKRMAQKLKDDKEAAKEYGYDFADDFVDIDTQ